MPSEFSQTRVHWVYTGKCMTRLDDIREGLYRRKTGEQPPEAAGSGLASRPKDERANRIWPAAEPMREITAEDGFYRRPPRRIFFRVVAIVAAAAFFAIAGFIGYSVFFAPSGVGLEILSADGVSAGDPTTFTIRIANRGSVKLAEGVLTLTFPEGTLAPEGATTNSFGPVHEKMDIPDIPAGGNFQRDIRMRFIGMRDETKTITGIYVYRPEGIESKLTRQAERSVKIIRAPVAVTVEAPERVSSGQNLTVTVSVDSELAAALPDMTLGIDFPSGFHMASGDPPPGTDPQIWPLGDLAPGETRKIIIRGTLAGEPESMQAFHVRLGRFRRETQQWFLIAEASSGPAIASPFLFVRTALGGRRDGTVEPRSRLEGSVFFKNNLADKIENVAVSLAFPEELVDLGTIQATNGFYDVTRKILTWNPASEPRLVELGPGEEGTLDFFLTTKSSLPVRKFSDKNFLLPIATTIDTASPPPAYRGISLAYQDRIEFKFASSIALTARASYYDSPVANNGPMPPRTRKTTTYSISLGLSSGANNFNDVDVIAVLPGNVEWRDVVASDLGAINFNPANQEIVWHIPNLPAATGILRPPVSAVFQIALTPSDGQVNTSPVILKNISASGRDGFTDSVANAAAADLTTELRSDPRSAYNEWRVAP